MKKLLLTLGVLLAASMSNAAYLYWQLDNSSTDSTSVTIWSKNNGTGATDKVQAYGLAQDEKGNPVLVAVDSTNLRNNLVYAIDENSIQDGYSYYIEVTHSDSPSTYSEQVSADDFRTYTAESSTTSLVDIDNGDATVPIWHASGNMAPVPEPTSAILMMFGMAFLGLKRKNRSIA